jgi:hypothetical protein
MVAIQVLPLEPDSWPDVDEGHEEQVNQRVRHGDWRALPDRPTRIRRRRLGVLVAAVVALAGAVALVDLVASGPGSGVPRLDTDAGSPVPITDEVYVVQPGDTLWSIAERIAPDSDPRPIVEELREMTGGVELDVGDRVPVGES